MRRAPVGPEGLNRERARPPAELLGLFFTAQEFVEAQFQYWLSISFAAIVGAFAAGARLSRRMRRLLVGMYVLASALFLLRDSAALGELATIAQEAGGRGLLGSSGEALTLPIVVVRSLLFLLGTSTTI